MSFWVYENIIHKFARIHDASCSFCGDGHGIHGGGKTPSGMWHGPFDEIENARAAALRTKQPNIRGCSLCVGGQTLTIEPEITPNETRYSIHKADWDKGRELNCSLKLKWIPQGLLVLDNKERVSFPRVQANAGLYRFAAKYPDGRFGNYIGESDNLSRRFGNYRNPGSSQLTNVRINFWLKELLDSGGEVSVSIVEKVYLNGELADLSRKANRRMFEQMAIALEHAEDVESLNR
jgi:hypothetical protein